MTALLPVAGLLLGSVIGCHPRGKKGGNFRTCCGLTGVLLGPSAIPVVLLARLSCREPFPPPEWRTTGHPAAS
jgi:hypothetical protein